MHLYSNYSRISAIDMAAKDKRIRSPYKAEETIGSIVKRINECKDFAAATDEPVTDTHITCIAYRPVDKNGQYPEYYWAWRAINEKSWTVFQAHFIEAQYDLQESQQTARQGVYGTNNLVGIKEAFSNLGQETAEDREAVTNLTGANITLINQVAK